MWLSVISGLPPAVHLLEEGETVIGRQPGCGITLDHREISRQHCKITRSGYQCLVADLGSLKGTRLNEAEVSGPTPLDIGDQLHVGPVILLVGSGETPMPVEKRAESESAPPVLMKGHATETVPLRDKMIFGRDENADVVLGHAGVSRQHAEIRRCPTGWKAIDLSRTTGAFINGHRFDENDLVVGDRLQIGPYFFCFDGTHLRSTGPVAGGAIEASGVVLRVGSAMLLDHVNVAIPAGSFSGIIGPSGAGKSSLLSVLGGLRPVDEGTVFVDGIDMQREGGGADFGYVPQEDIVHCELTVVEALEFAAELRLSGKMPRDERRKLVLRTMRELGLAQRAGTRIGRLSGGQRKRVSVGVEMLARPPVLFLDEPTSGLDPATEFQLMEQLRDLADSGCTVVCTTHVMENVYLVDQLIVMAAGQLRFTGTSEEVRSHFGVTRLSALYDRLSGPGSGTAAATAKSLQRAGGKVRTHRKKTRGSFLVLMRRQWAILRADPRNFAILAGQPVLIGLLVAWASSEASMVLFFACIGTLWFGASNGAQEIVRERPIYKRERLIGVGRNAYLASKFVFLGTSTLVQGLLLWTVLTLCEGGLPGVSGLQLVGIAALALAATGIGCAISAMARSVMQAVLVVPLVLIPFIVLSGHPIPAHEMRASVHAVAQGTPVFAARTLMDASFLWNQKLARETLSDHWTSFRNLNRGQRWKTGETFHDTPRIAWSLGALALWLCGSYAVAWGALRLRERTME